MLLIEPARRPRRGGKVGVALAGGGPLGAFYEIGALHALNEAMQGRDFTALDVYVGVSSGALVAAGLVNGLDTAALASTYALGWPGRDGGFSPSLLLQPALTQYWSHLRHLPEAVTRAAYRLTEGSLQNGWSTLLSAVAPLLPNALFDNRQLETYLRGLFHSPGHTDDFRALPARLYVVATDLDTCESVAFGAPGLELEHVPISRAVVASSALPGLYAPVRIDRRYFVDGALMRTMHASLALEQGCGLVICINPLVPFDVASARGRHPASLASAGLPAVLSQTFRALIHSRMEVGRSSYREHFPHADSLLLEPDRGDARLFFTNVFRYSGRHCLVEYAYQRTRRDLLRQAGQLAPVLARHGIELNLKVLRERRRRLIDALQDKKARARDALAHLNAQLARLEGLLAPMSAGG